MRKPVLFAVLLAFLIAPAAAVALDLNAPWWRGEWSTTSQYWEFNTPQTNPIQPDGSPAGGNDWLPSTMLWVYPGPGMGWVEGDYGMEGVWQLSGRIDVIVDNHDPKPENEKWLWVQMTWRPQDIGSGVRPVFDYFMPPPAYAPVLVKDIDLGMGWTHSTYEWKLDWNPPDESFGFGGPINIDELVIDTWCIPEPGTIASLIGLGLTVGLIYWRRRK